MADRKCCECEGMLGAFDEDYCEWCEPDDDDEEEDE